MVDVTRDRWPADLRRASESSSSDGWEGVAEDALHSLRRYIHEQPETAALCALGLGFVLGWKLKIW